MRLNKYFGRPPGSPLRKGTDYMNEENNSAIVETTSANSIFFPAKEIYETPSEEELERAKELEKQLKESLPRMDGSTSTEISIS